jgi:hypothetical protein
MSENNLKNIKPNCFVYCLTDNGDHPDHDVGEETDPDDGAEEGEHEPAVVFLAKGTPACDFLVSNLSLLVNLLGHVVNLTCSHPVRLIFVSLFHC